MRTSYIVFAAPERVEVHKREVPPPGPEQALVRTTVSLISTGTELTLLRGGHVPGSAWDAYGKFPVHAGYCNVGVVEAVGDAVTHVQPGDRVTSEGPHAGLYVMAAADLRPVPAGVPDQDAAFATIGEIVFHGVRRAGITLGESAFVCGLGLLGQLTVQMARFVGAWPVVGVDTVTLRRDRALAGGASHVVAPEAAHDAVAAATDGFLADAGFEVTGNPDAIEQQIGWLRKLGRLVILSSPRGPTTLDFHDMVNARGTTLIGAHNFTHASVPNEHNRWTRHSDACLFLRLLEARLLSCSHLVTHIIPAARAPEAYGELLRHPDRALAVLLDWRG